MTVPLKSRHSTVRPAGRVVRSRRSCATRRREIRVTTLAGRNSRSRPTISYLYDGAAFVALVGTKRRRKGNPAFRGRVLELRQALTASMIGFVVGAFFLSLAYHEILYTLLALAVAMGKVSAMAHVTRRKQAA